ncbi:carbohydrate sulfotransferase 5 [Drosophila nasuta]|uniref:carbohydrate sulfotransferase 5 n=1 Tax=Drosophila nasuta TaxID=42062 RepID=UPI00295E8B53|nr:carbohydrate sulfotransferase 5 [Drosophila nasuta]
MVNRGTKFTGVCIAIYLIYALFVFVILPMLMPNPVAMSRSMLAQQTRHLGDLSKYSLETGGKPVRSMLVSFRGSGALKLLDYLTRQPGNYHHFSPLIAYRNRITQKSRIERALNELVSLYNCDYNNSLPMLAAGMKTPSFKNFYGMQWKTCVAYTSEVCWDPEIMANICRIFPFINMSVYNLGLKYLSVLLRRKDLNLRILLLIRDPRGTMASRSNRAWCAGNPECSQPNDLCASMVDDYSIAEQLLHDYPDRFSIIRYEELAMDPSSGLKKIFDFYGLPMKTTEDKFKLKLNSVGLEKTNSLLFERPMEWMDTLLPHAVEKIENVCEEAMNLWGYNPIAQIANSSSGTFVSLKTMPIFVKPNLK